MSLRINLNALKGGSQDHTCRKCGALFPSINRGHSHMVLVHGVDLSINEFKSRKEQYLKRVDRDGAFGNIVPVRPNTTKPGYVGLSLHTESLPLVNPEEYSGPGSWDKRHKPNGLFSETIHSGG